MRQVSTRPRVIRWHQHLVLSLVSFCLILPPSAIGATSATSDGARLDQQIEDLSRIIDMARELRREIDRSTFDPGQLVEDLDFDAEEIFRFVKEDVAFEQYPGTLRGAQGTLMARAGNAIDQAILLATLLRDAGYEARIVEGTLNEAQARQLVRGIAPAPRFGQPVGDATAIVAILEKYARVPLDRDTVDALRAGLERGHVRPTVAQYPEISATSDYLRAKLKQAGMAVGEANAVDLVAEAQSYHWVQWRETAAGSWKELHPAFPGSDALVAVSPTRFFADSIPSELQHRLRFQMFIEVRRGANAETVAISEPWEAPISNLVSEPISFGNLPDTMLGPGVPALDFGEALESASYFAPVFRGQVPPGGRFFDLNGNVIDPMVIGDPALGVFKNVADAFGSAGKDLGGDQATSSLTAQWVEYALIEPGGASRTIRRSTFDRIGPAARARGDFAGALGVPTADDARSLIQRHTFMVTTGRTPTALALDFALSRMEDTYPAIVALLRAQLRDASPSRAELERMARIPADWSGHLALFSAFDNADTLQPDVASYRSGPAIVAHRQGLETQGQTVAAIDILTNPRRSIRVSDQTLAQAPLASMLGGIWESDMEGRILDPGGKRIDTKSALEAARDAAIPIVVVKPGESTDGLGLPPDALFHLRSDLNSDFAVIAPKSAPGGDTTGWWRVNLRTGETLAQLGDGRGSVYIEYLNAFSLGFSLGMLACGLVGCAQSFGGGAPGSGADARMTCCVIANFALFGLGYLGGMVASGARASTAAATGMAHWDQALAIATGSAAYDIMTSFIPVCR